MKAVALVAVLGAVATGCGRSDPLGLCPPYLGVGLVLTIQNDKTGEAVCDAVVTAQSRIDGSTWRLDRGSGCTYQGAFGTVVVHVERPGFTPATEVVEIGKTAGACPIAEPAYVTIRLVPLPS
jgi:hypothetical protein